VTVVIAGSREGEVAKKYKQGDMFFARKNEALLLDRAMPLAISL
jgi:hypothetical protein